MTQLNLFMKTKFTLLAILMGSFFWGFAQQIPNGGFELWTNVNTPTGWGDVESILSTIIPIDTSIFTFEDTTTFTQGRAAVKLVTDTVNGPYSSTVGTQPAVVSLGTATLDPNNFNPIFTGIPFTYRPDSVIFDYMLSSPGSDTGAAFINLSKKTVPLLSYEGSGGLGLILTIDTVWTHMAISLAPYYVNDSYPDTLLIQFVSSYTNNPIVGTTLHIDGARFGYVNPPLSVTTGVTTFCAGDSVYLQANTGTSTGYTYQWNVGGTAIAGATSAVFYAKNSGAYTVTIDSASSTATSQAILVADTNCTTGINNIAAASLSVYPNPASSLLNITSNENLSGFNLQMFDIVGRPVVSQVLEGNSNAVNVARLANGTYIYRITDKENSVVAQSKFNVIK
jgi:hypothetical protein